MSHSIITAGIDTAKAMLDVAIPQLSKVFRVPNDVTGWRQIASRLKDLAVTRVAIEASGGYERGVADHLREMGLIVLTLQPAQVKAYARARLRRAKNDKLDAALIAQCADSIAEPRQNPDKRLQILADHLTFVEQIEDDIVRIKTRCEHVREARLRRMLNADLARLKLRRAAELKRIEAVIVSESDLARRFALVASVPGIGERTAIALIVRMPELGHLTREQAAALAGLAPFDDDSGARRGVRRIAGGRARLRKSIYAAALPAAFRWNTALINIYRRLIAKGKSHKTALVACARKLVIYANTVVQRDQPWVNRAATA